MERYRLLGIEHGGRESASARVVSREPNKWGVFPLHTFNSGDEVVLAADAQATIAALQARAEQAERLVALQAQEILQRRQTLGDLAHLHQQQSKELTQRTAELEAAKAVQAIDLKNNNAYREQVATLQAELERVRADNKALDEWRADVTVSLQRPGGAFFVDVPQHIKDLVKERDDLRTLILALPKVEGAVVVSNGYVKDSTRCHALFGADEDAALYAALLQHRQGME